MRRLGAVLMAAGLAVAPSGAVAGPNDTKDTERWTQIDAPSKHRLGVLVHTLTPELREHFGAAKDRGVLVARVEPGSTAAMAGIKVGDVIIDVRGDAVDDASDVRNALAKAKQGDSISVQVIRNRAPMTLQAKLAEPSAMLDIPRWWRNLFTRPDTT